MIDSRPLTHRLEGDGPPVVLLNGGMMTFASWEPVAARFMKRYRVLRFDFRGQLRSPGAGPADLGGHAVDLVALLDAVGWESAHLVGTSFGAEVALELAARHPNRVRSLVAITAMDRAEPEFQRDVLAMQEVLAEVRQGGERGRFYDLLIDSVYSQRYRQTEASSIAARRAQTAALPLAWFEGVDALLAAIDGFDLTPRLGNIRAPALVVLAADDQVISPTRGRALAAAIGAEIALHPTSGHGLVAEDPEWLAGVCLDFLDRQEQESP